MTSRGPFEGKEFDQVRDLAVQLRRQLRGAKRYLGPLLGAVLALSAALTSYYQVEAEEVGLITRLGRYLRESPPGAHFKLPFGIERVFKVPVQRQLKQEFGFRTTQAAVRSQYVKDTATAEESLMLTGDLNVATVEWIVQYKIADPYKYLFKVRDIENTFRLMAEATMREVVGDHSVTELLTVGREEIAADAKARLIELCKTYETGIDVQQLVLQNVDPPDPVKPSFNEVNQAIQERERAINEALAEYNREIPRARGLAEQQLQSAEGYAVARVNRAKGDAQRFLDVQAEYKKSPEVTRTRLHLETMAAVLPRAGRKLIVEEGLRSIVPLLQLGGLAKEGK